MKPRYKVCDRCATSVENDDWTWIDAYVSSPAASQAIHDRMLGFVDMMGEVTRGDRLEGDYFVCWICDADEIGGWWYA